MLLNFLLLITSVFASFLGLTAIVVVHEFGHFIFCKLFNIYTPTFSIGMGKVLYSKKIGQTNFCLSAAPIGGYVEIASEKGIGNTKGFDEIPYYQKCLIMLGGIACNFILTYLIFLGLFFTGMPESGLPYEVNTTVIKEVPANSINSHLLQPNDTFIKVSDIDTHNDASILRKISLGKITNNEKLLPATILRNNQPVNVLLNLHEKPSSSLSNMLNITLEKKPPLSFFGAAIAAYKTTKFCLYSIISALKDIASAQSLKSFIGPIMVIKISSQSAQKGFANLLLLLAIISINLGFMNLLPLPIFDGGQFVIFTIEAITRKQLSKKTYNAIGASSWVLAAGLMVIFLLRDSHTLILELIRKLIK